MKEEQKKLEERVKLLEEKVIEKLKNGNQTTRQAISQLESMTNELEQRLRQISQPTETSRPQEETKSRSFLKKCVNCGKDIPIASEECQYCGTKQPQNLEPMNDATPETRETTWTKEHGEERKEEAVIVSALEDSVMVQQEDAAEDSKKGNGKKKGRFF